MKRHLSWVLPLLTGALLVGLWYLVRWERWDTKLSQPFILATPDEIWKAMVEHRSQLLSATRKSGIGALLGFSAATVGGFALAVVLSLSGALRASLYPYLMALQMTPIIVIAPIILLLLGAGTLGVVTITFLVCFFPIVANTTQGLLSTDRNLVDLFRMSNAGPWQELFLLRVPAALPYFFTGLRIAGTLAPIGAIVGDMYAGNTRGGGGLGFYAYVYNSQANTPALYATGVVSCVLGFCFVSCVLFLNWLALHKWHDSFSRPGD
jgi:NitT/TauT family transport system permease protein